MTGHELLFQYRSIAYSDTPPEGMTRREQENLRECFDLISGRGYDYRVPVDEFIRALEYAHPRGLHVEAVPEKETLGLLDGWVFQFEFSEIRRKALGMVKRRLDSGFDSAEYLGIWKKHYVYVPFNTSEAMSGDFSITGLAHYILIPVDGSRPRWERSLNFCKYDSARRYRYGSSRHRPTSQEIPATIRKAALRNGCNAVTFCGTLEDGTEVYSIYSVDEDGHSMFIGLPELLLLSDSKLVHIFGEESFAILTQLEGQM